ncbi:uncharacterized protein [Rutidosis leptorrhynchoides]|uniref:uncharacterized protein n=1 Tax=Rutidosis leptorrhynchoides TaxID=125765 RepID=UPI003A9A55A9
MKESSLMLTLLISGPKSPGKDIDVYLRPLVVELKILWSEGVVTHDSVTNTYFQMKAMRIWTINDYPARGSLSGWSDQGYKACPTCNEDTPAMRVENKIVYVSNRQKLELNHPYRENLQFNGKVDHTPKPRKFKVHEIEKQLEDLLPVGNVEKNHTNGLKRKRPPKCPHNWTKISIFWELEYWKYLPLQHNLDVMHIEKNVLEAILGTLLMNDKSKDTHNARVDLEKLGIREYLWLKPKTAGKKDGKFLKPHAQYSLNSEDSVSFCKFIKEVKLPDGFGSNFRHKVNKDNNNITNMKSHDCHIMMQRLLPVGVNAFLHPTISTPITQLCAFFKKICARELMVSDMLKAQKQVVKLLCTFALIYPPAFFDIMIHLVMHLPEEAIMGGPVYMRWMYPIERYMKKLKNYVRNKAKPEGCIAEGYVVDEALTACSMSLEGIQRDLIVLTVMLTGHLGHDKLHWYVLNNCSDIDEYKNQFKTEYPNMDMKTNFPSWFTNKIRELRSVDRSKYSDELICLAEGPVGGSNHYTACHVNGVRFVVSNRDDRRTTQNSGILTLADEGSPVSKYYGRLEDIVELHYAGAFSVVLFRCRWFNTENTRKHKRLFIVNNITSIDTKDEWYQDDQHILATQAQQVFYIDDPSKLLPDGRSFMSLDADLDNMTYIINDDDDDDDDDIVELNPLVLTHDICDDDDDDDVVADDDLNPQIPRNEAFSSDDDEY